MIDLFRYRRDGGVNRFTEWLNALRDHFAQARIRVRLRQVQAGNFGDHAAVGEGVVDLRVHVGPGYRVYCGRHGRTVVILLCGGDKSTQPSDIARAKALWTEWKEKQT